MGFWMARLTPLRPIPNKFTWSDLCVDVVELSQVSRQRWIEKMRAFKNILVALLACYIDVAVCGLPSMGAASDAINLMPNWTMLRPHTIGEMSDGTFFAEALLYGKPAGPGMCYAMWKSPAGSYPCPDSEATTFTSDGVISKRR